MAKTKPTHKQRSDADRRARQASNVARKLTLLRILSGRGLWDKESLARELGEQCGRTAFTTKTVERDLQVLEIVGYAMEEHVGPNKRKQYRVATRSQFPNLNLSRDEILGQATATIVSSHQKLGLGLAAKPTTQRIAKQREEVEDLLTDAEAVMDVLGLKLADHSKHGEIIRTIQWSLIEGTQLTGEYTSPYQQKSAKLTLHPFRLCLVHQAWYLVAKSAADNCPKTYRVQRFKTLRRLSLPAEIPANFSIKEYFGNAWGVYRGSERYEVEIEFSADSAAIVQETNWHDTQRVVKHSKDGSVTLAFTVDGLDEIVWWVLGWSGRAKVIKPAELRAKVVEQLQTALKLNNEDATHARTKHQ